MVHHVHRRDGERLSFRAMVLGFAIDPDRTIDEAQWEARLAQCSEEGYNALFWVGSNELWEGDHKLLRLGAFPEARELSPEANERCIRQTKWLFRTAKRYGMQNFLYTQCIFYTKAFARAHGLDQEFPVSPTVTPSHNRGFGPDMARNGGVRNELTTRYVAAVFEEFVRLYEDLDGFYSPLGEPLPGDRASFFREAIAPGLKRSGRRPLILVHQWQVPLEDYKRDVVPSDVYDNAWLAFHTYNGEQITDVKPYPGVVQWAEETGLPTVVMVYPANALNLPFNSPRMAYDIVREMTKVEGFVGFGFWQMSQVKLSDLFRKALAYYAGNTEAYSDEPWIALLEEQYGDRRAAESFLRAFDRSTWILPELCALVYHPADVMRRELRLPFHFMTGNSPDSWMSSPVRGKKLIPVPLYARFAARYPERYRGRTGGEADMPPYYQEARWSSHGGSIFDILPEAHMARVRALGEEALAHADEALLHVKRNEDEAKRVHGFIKTYRLLSAYYEPKVRAAISALIYAENGDPADRAAAEAYADEAVRRYEEVADHIHNVVDPVNERLYGWRLNESGVTAPGLLAAEREERLQIGKIFGWPDAV